MIPLLVGISNARAEMYYKVFCSKALISESELNQPYPIESEKILNLMIDAIRKNNPDVQISAPSLSLVPISKPDKLGHVIACATASSGRPINLKSLTEVHANVSEERRKKSS